MVRDARSGVDARRGTEGDLGDLGDLMHVFDHALRTPLSALHGHLELVMDRAEELPADVVASLQVMARALGRIEAAIDEANQLEESTRALRSVV